MKLTLPEIISVGIYDTQIAVRNVAITKTRTTTMFEIEIPLEHGGISYINSQETPITPNTLICAKPGQMRHTRLPFKCYYVHMILHSGALFETLSGTPDFIEISAPEKYYKLFRDMCKLFESGRERDQIMLQSLILNLIHTVGEDADKTVNPNAKPNNHRAIEKAIDYINENLTSDLSLKVVSDHVGFSPIYFHNFFKTATCRTLHDYVEEQRIKKASNMLVSTKKTLTEIAYECGFSSQSYFSYAFKQKVGMTPREYAKSFFNRYEQADR